MNIEKIMNNYFTFLKLIKSEGTKQQVAADDIKITELQFYWGQNNTRLQEAITLSEGLLL